ncbi:unnamed protein product, partial [Prorocentrum cordatum]
MEQRLAATALGTLGSPAKCLGAYLMQDRRSSSASGNGASPSGSGCTWRFCGCPFSCLDLCLFYLIVDQFEELLKKYPEESEAVPWADAITNYHVRNNLARVVFVVNSDAAAQTLHNLDWRGHTRYKRVRMEPSTPDQVWMVPTIDPKLFSQCECNIGLYHLVCRALDNGIITRADVPRYVQRHLTRWELEFQVPFPQFLDPTWFDLSLPDAKRTLLRGLEGLLHDCAGQNQERTTARRSVRSWPWCGRLSRGSTRGSSTRANGLAPSRPEMATSSPPDLFKAPDVGARPSGGELGPLLRRVPASVRGPSVGLPPSTPGLSGQDANVMAKHV